MQITLTGSREDLIRHLLAQAAEHDRQSKAASSSSEKVRQAGMSAGLHEAVTALGQWEDTRDATFTGDPPQVHHGEPPMIPSDRAPASPWGDGGG